MSSTQYINNDADITDDSYATTNSKHGKNIRIALLFKMMVMSLVMLLTMVMSTTTRAAIIM